MPRSARLSSSTARFGTFAGVFTPNVLTILGIILFLRAGWVVGQVGLDGALKIVLMANAISLLTGLSLAAIATSLRVRAGGNYYIISRTLGLEIGGAIGIPLYLSQAISVAFYLIGFTEALLTVFPTLDSQVVATVVTLLFGLLAWIGADVALKIQFVVFGVLMAALVSFFAGGWGQAVEPAMGSAPGSLVGFWAVFAVFFPAVTGIEVGTSMSGDLKRPDVSIPRGTLGSILFTAVLYLLAVWWFATHATRDQLLVDGTIMATISRWPWLIMAGVFAATLSSALGSILAAPRTLQALASDRVVPEVLARRLGSPTEPRMAVLLTTAVAVGVIWLGDLNFVAPIITMFFLNTYGMTNLVAGLEALIGNPSFRPRFRVPGLLSMLGALACYGAMFLIHPWATVAAIVISYGLFAWLSQRAFRQTWGDVRSGLWFSLARHALLHLESEQWHVRNWRPNILVFTGQPYNREHLARVAEWLTTGRGLVSFLQIVPGDLEATCRRRLHHLAARHIRTYIQKNELSAFAASVPGSDFARAALTATEAHGVGGLAPNAVLLGMSESPEGLATQLQVIRWLNLAGKTTLMLRFDRQRGWGRKSRIHVWWGGKGGNAGLMLLLGHLVRQHDDWAGAELHVYRVIRDLQGSEPARRHVEALLEEVRVRATPVVLVHHPSQGSIQEVIRQNNAEADLVLMGMQVPEDGAFDDYGRRLGELLAGPASVLLVRSALGEEVLSTG